jgi:methionyl-tRNA formyltransferase
MNNGARRIRVAFFGTPAFAVPTLRRMAGDPRFEVPLVVTQPDRPAGRGRRLEPPPVKEEALGLGLGVYQPETLRTAESRQPLIDVAADLFVVAAYGQIFGPKTLAIPARGCVNVHASLLPRYRGASPITAAILNGDPVAGISLMVMDAGLDTGPVLAHAETPIGPDDTTASLGERLAELGADLTVATLPDLSGGRLEPTPQPAAGASLTRPLIKTDGWLNWDLPAAQLERTVRAMWPWPRAWTQLDGEPLQVHDAETTDTPAELSGEDVGTLVDLAGEPAVVSGDGLLVLNRLQPAGGKPMEGRAFLAGRRYALTQVLGGQAPELPPLVVPAADS